MIKILHGDCMEVMRSLEADSIDSIVTDPPYGIRFMGKAWDGADIAAMVKNKARVNTHKRENSPRREEELAAGTYDVSLSGNRAFQVWTQEWAMEALRVLKPGGWLLSFSSPRTYHRMACGIEDAGFEMRDMIGWLFGSGFPKSHNLPAMSLVETRQTYEQFGTALKPAHEPIAMARKPIKGTVFDNVLQHGTGALNIGACRIPTEEDLRAGSGVLWSHQRNGSEPKPGDAAEARWPANIIHDGSDDVLSVMPNALGQMANASTDPEQRKTQNVYGTMKRGSNGNSARGDSGSAARFFYCAKASQEDREEGCEHLTRKQQDEGRKEGGVGGDNPRNRGLKQRGNHHPTVKPTELMRYLCRLVTPPAGLILDPFMGSGSTGKAAVKDGFRFTGIERDEGYISIAQARLEYEQRQPDLLYQKQQES